MNDIQMLRKALWEILKPLIQLITNLLNPEKGEEWTRELKKFLRKEKCWVLEKHTIDLAKTPRLPFDNAEGVKHEGEGIVEI